MENINWWNSDIRNEQMSLFSRWPLTLSECWGLGQVKVIRGRVKHLCRRQLVFHRKQRKQPLPVGGRQRRGGWIEFRHHVWRRTAEFYRLNTAKIEELLNKDTVCVCTCVCVCEARSHLACFCKCSTIKGKVSTKTTTNVIKCSHSSSEISDRLADHLTRLSWRCATMARHHGNTHASRSKQWVKTEEIKQKAFRQVWRFLKR